jgi:hypothetical protein
MSDTTPKFILLDAVSLGFLHSQEGTYLFTDGSTARSHAEKLVINGLTPVYLYQLVSTCSFPKPKPIWESLVSSSNGHVDHS